MGVAARVVDFDDTTDVAMRDLVEGAIDLRLSGALNRLDDAMGVRSGSLDEGEVTKRAGRAETLSRGLTGNGISTAAVFSYRVSNPVLLVTESLERTFDDAKDLLRVSLVHDVSF